MTATACTTHIPEHVDVTTVVFALSYMQNMEDTAAM
jgi:hypothetical protein